MTSVVYAYAFLATPSPEQKVELEAIEGLQEQIQIISGPTPMAAAVEANIDLDAMKASDTVLLRSALRHDQVICQLFGHTSVIPLRFGTGFVSTDKLQDHLQQQASLYQQTLDSLSGRAEYLLKVFAPPEPDVAPVAAASGTAYLLARRQAYQNQQAYLQTLEQASQSLTDLWPASWPRQALDPHGEECSRITFLLDPEQYQQAVAQAQDWQQEHEGWRLDWGGGLPPYHFVQGAV